MLEYEHVVYESEFAGMRLQYRSSKPEIRQLAIKDEYGFVDSKNLLDRVSSSKRRTSSNTECIRVTGLAILITGTSQSRQHVITSLIHIESCKSPTKSLFDVGPGMDFYNHCEYLSITRDVPGKISRIMRRTLYYNL
ncbi:hypothetical protein Tco_0941321 [Tanacetum coccineum]|uniref:Uncharacterized protein n=1 Tax=Tanacetum coccineum TaxID=301880 RepID=A0ABQ5DQJ8_9ASTR